MPIMPRSDKKAEKVAWKVLGKPDNMLSKETEKERIIKDRIDYQVIVGGR
jgi:hypothetical protein